MVKTTESLYHKVIFLTYCSYFLYPEASLQFNTQTTPPVNIQSCMCQHECMDTIMDTIIDTTLWQANGYVGVILDTYHMLFCVLLLFNVQ